MPIFRKKRDGTALDKGKVKKNEKIGIWQECQSI